MSDVQPISAKMRERAGKGAARATRREGRIPAVIYGNKLDPVMISLDPIEMLRHLRGAFYTHVYEIDIDGVGKERVLARDVQTDPVTDKELHIDFMRFSKSTRVNVEVECQFINEEECPGLSQGGVLNVVRYTIELVCSPASIPEAIVIDLTGLEIGDSIHISNVTLPDDVEPVIDDRDFTIATIAAPTLAVEEEEEDGDEETDGEETEGDDEDADAEGEKDKS